MMGMTPREVDALRFIRQHAAVREGVTPTYKQIAETLGLASTSGVYRLVNGLVARGYLRRLNRCRNGLEIIQTENHLCPHCNRPLPQEIARAA